MLLLVYVCCHVLIGVRTDLKPFVGATYYPTGCFIEMLKAITDKWSKDRQVRY
jgi:uncharacterized protein YyaL (SSP411 family)